MRSNENHCFVNQWMNKGMIAAFYLIGYGGFRILMEFIRKEKVVAYGLTQAQFVMPGFILVGLGLLLYVYTKQHAAKRHG